MLCGRIIPSITRLSGGCMLIEQSVSVKTISDKVMVSYHCEHEDTLSFVPAFGAERQEAFHAPRILLKTVELDYYAGA